MKLPEDETFGLGSLIKTPYANKRSVHSVISTSKKLRSCKGCPGRSIKRKLSYDHQIEESAYYQNHQLFVCKEDRSLWTALGQYCRVNRKNLIVKTVTPGTESNSSPEKIPGTNPLGPNIHASQRTNSSKPSNLSASSSSKPSLLRGTNIKKQNLFSCSKTSSSASTKNKKPKQVSTSTSIELKCRVRNAFKLMKSLHKVDLTLCGQFDSENFVMDIYNNMRLGNLREGVVKKLDAGDSTKDTHRFVDMVRQEVFHLLKPPSDIEQWLDLVDSCVTAYDDLAEQFITLMEEHQAAGHFMSLHSMLEKMMKNDPQSYESIKKNLRQYNNWKKKVQDDNGNTHLKETLDHEDAATKKKNHYADDVSGLLKVLRNSRHHSAREKGNVFALIVGHNFPKLMGDFQKAMFREGYIIKCHT